MVVTALGPRRTRRWRLFPGLGPDIPEPAQPDKAVLDYYPIVTGLRDPTKCNNLTGDCGSNTDPTNLKCNGTNDIDEKNCTATVLDHYTTSFNFAQKNFSAIWLRPWWKAVTDSSITDQLGPGLTFVTGGGYTRSDSSLGNWNVGLRNVYVGQTQPDPIDQKATFFASDLGPFTPHGIPQCDNGQIPGGYCLSKDNGISIPITNFQCRPAHVQYLRWAVIPGLQRLSRHQGEDHLRLHSGRPRLANRRLRQKQVHVWTRPGPAARVPITEKSCYIPNAAIAWKQENGFYYPPAFHSRNLAFSNVDIRHFVIEPLFEAQQLSIRI